MLKVWSPKFSVRSLANQVPDENIWRGVQTFASQVKVNSHKPVLNLEEVEHHLRGVQCGQGTMHLKFVDTVSARDAFFSCRGDDGGLIITSHDSCNIEGERAVYRYAETLFVPSYHANKAQCERRLLY